MTSINRTTDIRNYYGFKSMMEISKCIEFAMQQSMYFAIIGDIGSGKTSEPICKCALTENCTD